MQSDLDRRLARLYVAVGATVERRTERLGVEVTGRPGAVRISFRGGQTDAELENAALQAISQVAHLRDHLKKVAKDRGQDPRVVEDRVEKSEALKILIDLANTDKHGIPRNGGLTKRGPRLTGLTRALRLTGGEAAPQLEIPLGGRGVLASAGDTSAVITGDVVDQNGNRLGELQELLHAGVNDWEDLLETLKPQGESV